MKIPAQTRTQTLGLIDEGSSVDPSDLEVLHRWMQATYETLHFNSVQQRRFDEYCRSCCDSTSVRLYKGLMILEHARHGNITDDYEPMYSQV